MEKKTNLAYMKTLTGGDKTKLKKYIDLFLQEAPPEIENLTKMLLEKNWQALRTTAHTLKPKLAYMGIKELENDIKSIEENAEKQIHLESLPLLIEKVKEVFNISIIELEEEKKLLL